jgi:dTDP-4-amino-4,6-dideoxygalactose transaminase
LQPIYDSLGYRVDDLPESERASKEALALPMYPELSNEQMERIAEALDDALIN